MDKLKLYNLPLSPRKPLDYMHKKFFEAKRKTDIEIRNMNFKKWLKYKNNLSKINCLYDICKEMLKEKGYLIINERTLKDEIASYIYYSSNAVK